jgi:hypothetical protein
MLFTYPGDGSMKFLLDMGLAQRTAVFMRAQGFDAIHLSEQGLQRLPDEQIVRHPARGRADAGDAVSRHMDRRRQRVRAQAEWFHKVMQQNVTRANRLQPAPCGYCRKISGSHCLDIIKHACRLFFVHFYIPSWSIFLLDVRMAKMYDMRL